jgi:hypothetical protein
MNRSQSLRTDRPVSVGRYVPGMAVGTPRRNMLVTLVYLVVLAMLLSSVM